MKRALMMAALALVAGLQPATSTSIEPIDLQAVSATAPLVIAGYVSDCRLIFARSGVSEYEARVKVLGVLRGETAAATIRLTLRQSLVHFDRLVEKDDSGVFFLKPAQNGTYQAAYPGSFALFQSGTVKRP